MKTFSVCTYAAPVAPDSLVARGFMTNFGSWLKKKREELNYKLEELAERAETTHPSLSRYENGKGGVPREGTIEKLARALSPVGDDRYLSEAKAAAAMDMLPPGYVIKQSVPEIVLAIPDDLKTLDDRSLRIATGAAFDTFRSVAEKLREDKAEYTTNDILNDLKPEEEVRSKPSSSGHKNGEVKGFGCSPA